MARGVAIAGLAVTLIVVGLAGRRVLNRRRLATWDTDWLATSRGGVPGGRPGSCDGGPVVL